MIAKRQIHLIHIKRLQTFLNASAVTFGFVIFTSFPSGNEPKNIVFIHEDIVIRSNLCAGIRSVEIKYNALKRFNPFSDTDDIFFVHWKYEMWICNGPTEYNRPTEYLASGRMDQWTARDSHDASNGRISFEKCSKCFSSRFRY